MNIYVAITTYNREDSYKKLLKDIEKNKGNHSLFIAVYDDYSLPQYVERNDGNLVYRFEENYGKMGHWKVIDKVFYDASFENFDYFFLLQDDCELVDDFFNKAIQEFEGIEDETKVSMCTFTPDTVYTRAMWGSKAVNVNYSGKTYLKSNYLDLIFMCPRKTLEMLEFKMNEIPNRYFDSANKSSGVGRQITGRLKLLGGTLYGAYDSLVIHDGFDSKMNEEERKIHPLHTMIRYTNKETPIVVGICSIKEREVSLYKTLRTLSPQVDKINVVLNGYTRVPEYASEFDNVVFELSSNERGDANKFKYVSEYGGYFFSCDDDILYPPDYIFRIMEYIKREPKGIYTYHGRVMTKEVTNFYKDTEQIHFMLEVKEDRKGHIPGTGVCGFDTRVVKVEYSDFKIANMADIFLGMWAQKNNIPITVINHKRGLFNSTGILFQDKSIYKEYKEVNERQCTLVNSLEWK